MGIVDDFLKGLPVNPVLREKIDILRVQVSEMNSTIDTLTTKNSELEEENSNLLREITHLKKDISDKKTSSNDFTPTRGLKIRNLPAGGYDESVAYCFHCESPLSSTHRTKNFECSKCGYKTSIQARHLCVVISELKEEKTPEWWRKY